MTITNDEKTSDVRPIEDLLKYDTFQGMCDAEILSLIDYHVKIAVKDEMFARQMEILQNANNAKVEEFRSIAETAKGVLHKLTAGVIDNV